MKSTKFLLWVLAIIITLASAIYQRRTGPTYPVDGQSEINGNKIIYSLGRSHGGSGDQPIEVVVPDTTVTGMLVYRRYNTNDNWTELKMYREAETLRGFLPHQPPAGKLEYHVVLQSAQTKLFLPEDENVVTRFKGAVPLSILLPHILFMFSAMLLSTRAGLEAFRKRHTLRPYVLWTICLLFIGGMILGPLVQKYAFGALWTGFPYGTDLTDNKTLIAMIGWVVALIAVYKTPKARGWVIAAAVILMLTYLIPHSVHGSELKYSNNEQQSSQAASVRDQD